jgi:hypothetical protein
MKIFIFVFSILVSTGCSNIFEGLSKKDTDEALFYDAEKYMDSQEWDLAIEKFESLSADYAARTNVREAWAGVLAGKCGLDFLAYFQALGSATLTGSTLFRYFMNAFTGKVVNPTSCTLAQAKIEEISADPAARTSSQNLFMAILGMVKMGVYLRANVDKDGTDGLGDGTPDVAVSVCTNNASNLPDSAVDEIITGFGLLTTNLTTVTTALSSGSVNDALTALNAVCGAISGICNKTSASDITNGDRDSFRDVLNTSSTNATAPLGVGSCNNAAVVPCC